MIETSPNIVALTAAILKVQGEISGVKKDGKNPHFKSKYATLENVIDTARPALQEAKIVFVQAPGQVINGAVEITTMLVHESGEWMRSTLHVPLGKVDPQGVGSAITYGLRYSLMAMLGLPPTDDDGEAATDRTARLPTPNTVTGPAIQQSSAALKRDGAWQKLMFQLSADFGDCKSLVTLSKLRGDYRQRAREEGWPKAWLEALANEFDQFEDSLPKPSDEDEFPGDKQSGRNSYVDNLTS